MRWWEHLVAAPSRRLQHGAASDRDRVSLLIDSVQSQANRMEEALQALRLDKKLTLPVIEVDLSKVPWS
jgi:hypothetical protein